MYACFNLQKNQIYWNYLFLDLTITPYPILLDNYSYIVKDSKSAIVVDPGDPQPVIVSLVSHQKKLMLQFCLSCPWMLIYIYG